MAKTATVKSKKQTTRKQGTDPKSTQSKKMGLITNSKTKKPPIFAMAFAKVYPHYIAKAEKKGRSKAEVDRIIHWLTGYTAKALQSHLEKETDFETFFAKAKLNPKRSLITGSVCGVKIQDITDPIMREIRYLDKLIDELAQSKPLEQILR